MQQVRLIQMLKEFRRQRECSDFEVNIEHHSVLEGLVGRTL